MCKLDYIIPKLQLLKPNAQLSTQSTFCSTSCSILFSPCPPAPTLSPSPLHRLDPPVAMPNRHSFLPTPIYNSAQAPPSKHHICGPSLWLWDQTHPVHHPGSTPHPLLWPLSALWFLQCLEMSAPLALCLVKKCVCWTETQRDGELGSQIWGGVWKSLIQSHGMLPGIKQKPCA